MVTYLPPKPRLSTCVGACFVERFVHGHFATKWLGTSFTHVVPAERGNNIKINLVGMARQCPALPDQD